VIKTAMKIDHHRSLIDTSTCQTFTEVIVTNKEKPYVLGTRMRVNRDKIAEIEILWTTTGYWLFNADAYLKWSSSEKWDVIPADQRDTRATLVAAANAYLDAVPRRKKDLVPWGYPCNRTEAACTPAPVARWTAATSACRRREHRQPPLHRGRDDRVGGGVLHLRRRRPQRRQRLRPTLTCSAWRTASCATYTRSPICCKRTSAVAARAPGTRRGGRRPGGAAPN
jgi:hypothetical protein